jgi:hypothetical protein
MNDTTLLNYKKMSKQIHKISINIKTGFGRLTSGDFDFAPFLVLLIFVRDFEDGPSFLAIASL